MIIRTQLTADGGGPCARAAQPRRSLRHVLLALVALVGALIAIGQPVGPVAEASAQASEPDVWFAPYPAGYGAPGLIEHYGARDFMALFEEDAAWHTARDRVDVFQFYFAWLQQAPSGHIRTAVEFLNNHGIAIAVEAPALQRQATCGINGEGWVEDHVAWSLDVLRAVAGAGGTVRYITMQEPYSAASPSASAPPPASCHWTTQQTAAHVADYVRDVRAVFPRVQFGDVESDHLTVDEAVDFAAAYHAALGEPLAFMHWEVDPAFRSDWPDRAVAVEAAMAARGIPFGMVYNGLDTDTSNGDWNSHAIDLAARYEGEAGGRPGHVKFQSWHPYPKQMLPENDPASMTSLINRYFEARTVTALDLGPSFGGSRSVTVTAAARGKPVAGATVEVSYEVTDGPGVVATYTISGRVPEGAGQATLGYRVNTECHCNSGQSIFSFYGAGYREAVEPAAIPSAPQRIPNGMFDSGFEPWHWAAEGAGEFVPAGAEPAHVRVDAAGHDTAALNSGWVDVTPERYFEARFEARVDPRSVGSGYFTVIFVAPDFSREISRARLPIEPPVISVRGATGADGVAHLVLQDLPAAAVSARARVTASPGRLTGFSPAVTVEASLVDRLRASAWRPALAIQRVQAALSTNR